MKVDRLISVNRQMSDHLTQSTARYNELVAEMSKNDPNGILHCLGWNLEEICIMAHEMQLLTEYVVSGREVHDYLSDEEVESWNQRPDRILAYLDQGIRGFHPETSSSSSGRFANGWPKLAAMRRVHNTVENAIKRFEMSKK